MFQLQKRERPFISVLVRKEEGGAHIYALCLGILFMFLVFFAVLLDYKQTAVTSEAVDDALVTSLVSSMVYNKEEEALSGATVMYRTVTASGYHLPADSIIPGYVDVSGNLTTTVEDRDILGGSTIRSPLGDMYLGRCYQLFYKNLKKNLKLQDDGTSALSGIKSEVVIQEFSIYNQYFNLDEHGSQSDFMFIKYTRVGDGVYSVTEYPKNTYPTCYNSLTKSDYTITHTSVAATLSFQVAASRYGNTSGKIDTSGTETDITYTRVVDILSTR